MSADPGASPPNAALFIGMLLVIGAAFVWSAVRPWRSTPESWLATIRGRPGAWPNWPPFSWMLKELERHPRLYLWQARVIPILGLLFLVLSLLIFGNEFYGWFTKR